MRLAVGDPLELPAGCGNGGEVTKEAVDALHNRYLAEMRRLFDSHKVAAGYPEAELIIK